MLTPPAGQAVRLSLLGGLSASANNIQTLVNGSIVIDAPLGRYSIATSPEGEYRIGAPNGLAYIQSGINETISIVNNVSQTEGLVYAYSFGELT